MSNITGRISPPSGESSLDARLCAEIGEELARVRGARGLSLAQVSEKLLLSIRQVKALEEVEYAAFHNATFYLNALKKYARFADLDPALMTKIASAMVRTEVTAVDLPAAGSNFAGDDTARRGLAVVVSVLLVAAAVGAGGYFLWVRGQAARAASVVTTPHPAAAAVAPPPQPPPPEPAREPAVISASEAAPITPPADTVIARTPAIFGTLRVAHPTWIFVRDSENMVTEKTLAEGESFEFETQPTYLAVGGADAELTIGGARIDVARFVTNGQIRIRAGDFDALVQGASPIPAPTAAASR